MNKKTIYWTVGGIVVAGLGYFIYKRFTKKTDFGEIISSPTEPVKPIKVTPKSTFPLKKGSEGKEVVALQKFLKDEGLGWLLGTFGKNKDGVDGKFGSMTEQAVKNQQSPFTEFKMMYPKGKYGEVSEYYYNMFIKGKY